MPTDLASLHQELDSTINQIGWACIYSRVLEAETIDAKHAASLRRKLDEITIAVQKIQSKMPELKEIANVQRTAA